MAIKNHHYGNHRCTLPRAQTGAVLLAFILVFIVGSTFYLTIKLNTNQAKTQHSVETGIAMNVAKNALIGYAISYPDKINANEGPGYLPCPDISNNGAAGGSCSLTGTTSIGRFPYKTLETEELRDGHGERLWYVISDNFRNNPKMIPLNSETAGNSSGDMTVDGYTNIAAVIFSAEATVNNQNRISANENDYTHYIEATFTDSDSDAVLDSITTADTDRYILLTKDELMQAVEKRVLGEVKQTLSNYQTNYSAYPWLSPFANPSTSVFRGVPTTTFQGHIPFHWANDPDSIVVGTGNNTAGRNPFQSSVGWIWHTDIGTATETFSGTITVDCLRNVDCSDGTFPQLTQVTTPAIDCTWSDKDTVNCPSAGTVTMSTIACDYGCGSFTCTREYQIDIPEYTGTTSVTDPTDTTTRIRDVTLNGSLPIQTAAIRIEDTYIGDNPSTFCVGTTALSIGSGVINFTALTTGTLQSTGIQYDLDVDDDELPSWFFSNEWNHLIYIAYPPVETLPGGATLCTAGTDCLVVNNAGTPNTDKRALVIIAGQELPFIGQDRTVSPTIDDWFENENASPVDTIFEKGDTTNSFNDQIKVISISP